MEIKQSKTNISPSNKRKVVSTKMRISKRMELSSARENEIRVTMYNLTAVVNYILHHKLGRWLSVILFVLSIHIGKESCYVFGISTA